MSDKSAAYLFGTMFVEMAEVANGDSREVVVGLAAKFYKESLEFDFNDADMDADEALTILGLARMKEVNGVITREYGP